MKVKFLNLIILNYILLCLRNTSFACSFYNNIMKKKHMKLNFDLEKSTLFKTTSFLLNSSLSFLPSIIASSPLSFSFKIKTTQWIRINITHHTPRFDNRTNDTTQFNNNTITVENLQNINTRNKTCLFHRRKVRVNHVHTSKTKSNPPKVLLVIPPIIH